MNNYITKEQLRILLFDQPDSDYAINYARKFLSRYVVKSYLKIIDEDTSCPMYRTTSTGRYILNKAMQHLFGDGIMANNKIYTLHDITEYISMLYASKRFKTPRNKKHSAAIGNHLAAILHYSASSLFKCQLEYSATETTFRSYNIPKNNEGIRSDMFYAFTPFMQYENEIQVYFELDTGYQSSNVILQKLKNYMTLFMEKSNILYRPVLHFSFLFSSYRNITLSQDEIERFEKTLQLKKIIWPPKETNQFNGKNGLHFLFSMQSNTDIIGLIKITEFLINRREIIVKKANTISQLSYLALKGLSIYCSPAKYDNLFLPLLHPESTNGYLHINRYLNMMKAGILQLKEYRPLYQSGDTILIHDFTYRKADRACCHVAVEHFSLDIMSSIRIEQFLSYFTSKDYMEPTEPLYLLCFFLSADLNKIRTLSMKYQLYTRYSEDKYMRFLSEKSEILFVCVEDYFMDLLSISFNHTGKGIYKLKVARDEFLLYELPEKAKTVAEKQLINPY
jgi:hypothetical protein